MKLKHLFLGASLFASILTFGQLNRAYHVSLDTVPLPDGSGVSYQAPLLVYGYGDGQIVTDTSEITRVTASLEHSYLGDLVISLTCPNGQSTTLQAQSGGGTYLGEPIDNGYQDNNEFPGVGYEYCWTMNTENGTLGEAATSVSTLPAGDYSPYQSFSNLIGCPLNGVWTLVITDNWSSDDGYLMGWSIDFDADNADATMVEGYAFADVNENNTYDAGDFPMSNVLLRAEPGPYYAITNAEGYYKMFLPIGEYDIEQIELPDLWTQTSPFDPSSHHIIAEGGDTINYFNFGNVADVFCPHMIVDINMNNPIVCMSTNINVHYENAGSVTATSATIDVLLDDNLSYTGGGNLIAQDGQLLTFDIGDVASMESGYFNFNAEYACDQELTGSTACVEAHIYPDSTCVDDDPEWDHSSVMVNGECVDDEEVCFTITNTGEYGEGDMAGISEYRVFEDDILVETGTFQINGGETETFCFTANGSTIRFEADQRPGHPGNSHPNDVIESCGSPNNSTGFVMNYPQDDLDDFIEIDCCEVLNSYDPNDKSAIPQGLAEAHYIDSTTQLEYKIRFQNTGTAPAQRVIIMDSISEHMDITSINFLGSSHACVIDFPDSHTIRWTFDDINLPDSTSDLEGSQGFVKFKIDQVPNNPIHTFIYNDAQIYFDYNLPIYTNELRHTIGEMDLVYTDISEDVKTDNLNVFPNPTSDQLRFQLDEKIDRIEIYDIAGRLVQSSTNVQTNLHSISLKQHLPGTYVYRIFSESGKQYRGKFLLTGN